MSLDLPGFPAPSEGWRGLCVMPEGLLGWWAGWHMARANRRMNREAVRVLAPCRGESVLEIGFGPGIALRELVRRVGSRGRVTGLDPSEVMVAQALRRNRHAVEGGVLDVRVGCVSELTGSFDRILAVNTLQLWPDLPGSLQRVRRALTPGGTFVVGLRRRREGTAIGFTEEGVRTTVGLLEDAGFRFLDRGEGEDVTWLTAHLHRRRSA